MTVLVDTFIHSLLTLKISILYMSASLPSDHFGYSSFTSGTFHTQICWKCSVEYSRIILALCLWSLVFSHLCYSVSLTQGVFQALSRLPLLELYLGHSLQRLGEILDLISFFFLYLSEGSLSSLQSDYYRPYVCFHFCFFFLSIHLFTCAYIVWVISGAVSGPHLPPTPPDV
jgi:hypothetical protein